MSRRPRHACKRFFANERGVAAVEFVLIFPILFLLLFGSIEVVRLMLIHQKLEKTGYVISDITSQYAAATVAGAQGEISQAEMDRNVFPQFTRTMEPYENTQDQAAIITSIRRIGGQNIIQWQVAGGGTLSGCDGSTPATCVRSGVNGLEPSAITPAVEGQTATFTPEVNAELAAMAEGSNILVTEVFYFYRPILSDVLRGVTRATQGSGNLEFFLRERIYGKRTYIAPRNNPLLHLPPNFPVN